MAVMAYLGADEQALALALAVSKSDYPSAERTEKLDSVIGSYVEDYVEDGVPRLPVEKALTPTGPDGCSPSSALFQAMRRHGYVVLTDLTEGAPVYERAMELIRSFFTSEPCGGNGKTACVGAVYENERGVPMWHCGYELCEDGVREAFRVHATAGDSLAWPCSKLQKRWGELTDLCAGLTDRLLATLLEASEVAGEGGRSEVLARLSRCRAEAGDLSVAYALHYPNGQGGEGRDLPVRVAGEAGINVKEHVDPSLLVVEPIAEVPGLEVLDQAAGEWVSVEACARSGQGGQEWVLFGGRALEAATQGQIKACRHRVTTPGFRDAARRAARLRRFCFIFEQKLADFYEGN